MATAEMKMPTTAQPVISDEGSDKDGSYLDHEEGYSTNDDVSDDYASESDASNNGNLIFSGSSPICKKVFRGRGTI